MRGSFLATCFAFTLDVTLRKLFPKPFLEEEKERSEKLFFLFGSLIVHEILYFGFNGVLFLIERNKLKVFHDYFIPRLPSQIPDAKLIRKTLLSATFSHFVIQPLIFYYGYEYIFLFQFWDTKLNNFFPIMAQLASFQFFESFLFYLSHRFLHTRALFATVHKKHHEYHGPNGFAAEYAHPIEQFLGNYFPVLFGPCILFRNKTHTTTWLTWLAWRLIQTYERHSGFDFSETIPGRIGLFNGYGARYHDLHHVSTVIYLLYFFFFFKLHSFIFPLTLSFTVIIFQTTYRLQILVILVLVLISLMFLGEAVFIIKLM